MVADRMCRENGVTILKLHWIRRPRSTEEVMDLDGLMAVLANISLELDSISGRRQNDMIFNRRQVTLSSLIGDKLRYQV
ncbi:hypothetical protein HanPSC8_Chr13g0564731 [Helianthus annuus]|nr:hypothetical protein HanPSC8_Chr13g0564731 [Helianthus annuus]